MIAEQFTLATATLRVNFTADHKLTNVINDKQQRNSSHLLYGKKLFIQVCKTHTHLFIYIRIYINMLILFIYLPARQKHSGWKFAFKHFVVLILLSPFLWLIEKSLGAHLTVTTHIDKRKFQYYLITSNWNSTSYTHTHTHSHKHFVSHQIFICRLLCSCVCVLLRNNGMCMCQLVFVLVVGAVGAVGLCDLMISKRSSC